MPAMPSCFRYLLLCCLALPSFAMGMDRLSLAEGWRACGTTRATPAASLYQLLKPGQLLCAERDITVAATPSSTQLLVLSALASSELWLDDILIGSNGQPARQASGERAGDIDFAIHLTPRQLSMGRRLPAWRRHCMRCTWLTGKTTARRWPGTGCRRCCWPGRWVPSPCCFSP